MGLLSDDSELHKALELASTVAFGAALRELFATLLCFGNPVDPVELWERHRDAICEDYTKQPGGNREVTTADYDKALTVVQNILNGFSLDLQRDFKISFTPSDIHAPSSLLDQTELDIASLNTIALNNVNQFTDEQSALFDLIMVSVNNHDGRCFGLDAPGGTGKTFLITTLLATIRARGEVAIATATSGIAATLLPLGRTLHSSLKVPLDVDESSMCYITPRDQLASDIRQCRLLVIDEVTMAHKHIYEAIDRTLRDITGKNKTFGGLTVLLSGDWRQILPVVLKGSRAQIVDACLKRSYLWPFIHQIKLTKNVRLCQETADFKDYEKFLLNVGEGNIAPVVGTQNEIEIPSSLLLQDNSISSLCDFVYGERRWHDSTWISARAILSPTNDGAGEVNDHMIEVLPGSEVEQKSADSLIEDNAAMALQYPPEFLNSIRDSGLPPHRLRLKPGCPIMLLRNLDPSHGHCNGSRYIVNQVHQYLIDATVAFGPNVGMRKLIPRIALYTKEKAFPFRMKRIQFPVRLSFGITMNKAQGQTFEKQGIYLDRDVFSHGQMYVGLSRVRDPSKLKIMTKDASKRTMKNVVFKEVLNN